ncbi:hypothetical protein EDEG_01752 [Edhazardia aedis USNM 41457]|uniref:BZIP domain-containing protein n=1 Tax=Edhazardia aedis (strain USNM 41457) TaxID=1003232 RepID=J9D8Y1_EDHAE|nr:hypothetical protein EDEG_01752 [Edhazardia aedis USNM 41457]|eukprot:EJW03959.1 hypothetical protein EDEG_01752 [Edhazardia aedis USNM 41457]
MRPPKIVEDEEQLNTLKKNRLSARLSYLKRKAHFEDLRNENEELKSTIRNLNLTIDYLKHVIVKNNIVCDFSVLFNDSHAENSNSGFERPSINNFISNTMNNKKNFDERNEAIVCADKNDEISQLINNKMKSVKLAKHADEVFKKNSLHATKILIPTLDHRLKDSKVVNLNLFEKNKINHSEIRNEIREVKMAYNKLKTYKRDIGNNSANQRQEFGNPSASSSNSQLENFNTANCDKTQTAFTQKNQIVNFNFTNSMIENCNQEKINSPTQLKSEKSQKNIPNHNVDCSINKISNIIINREKQPVSNPNDFLNIYNDKEKILDRKNAKTNLNNTNEQFDKGLSYFDEKKTNKNTPTFIQSKKILLKDDKKYLLKNKNSNCVISNTLNYKFNVQDNLVPVSFRNEGFENKQVAGNRNNVYENQECSRASQIPAFPTSDHFTQSSNHIFDPQLSYYKFNAPNNNLFQHDLLKSYETEKNINLNLNNNAFNTNMAESNAKKCKISYNTYNTGERNEMHQNTAINNNHTDCDNKPHVINTSELNNNHPKNMSKPPSMQIAKIQSFLPCKSLFLNDQNISRIQGLGNEKFDDRLDDFYEALFF